MKLSHCLGALLACVFLTGCLGDDSSLPPSTIPDAPPASVEQRGTAPSPSAQSDVIRTGDKIIIRVTGIPDPMEPQEVQISTSGEVTMPLLTHSFQAIGHTTADLAAEITKAYKDEKIYTNPNVTVISEERYVNVGGDVRNPARVIYTPDLTLLGSINACSGFDEYANRHKVRIIRPGVKDPIVIDATQAQSGGTDPALYPGDQVYVPRTPW